MPPLVPRKRLRESPSPGEGRVSKAAKEKPDASRRKATLYDDLDASATPNSNSILHGFGNDEDDQSSLTSLSDEEFEDVVPPKKSDDKDEASGEDEDIEFEDVEAPAAPLPDAPVVSGDLELTLTRDTRISLTNTFDRKGPSKRERKVRHATHCVHVMLLLWHNATRNAWLCDPEVQATMISHLPPRLWDEVDRWRRNSGLEKKPMPGNTARENTKSKGKGKKGPDMRSRDWGAEAERLEEGAVDMSHGDPLFRLMQILSAWWKQRFQLTAPGLRKWGYMSLERLDRLTKAQKAEPHDPEQFGENISDLEAFRHHARICEGSRDVGAQLFTALLRGLGLEARMVANLPCLGFGWNKLEEAEPEKSESANQKRTTPEKKMKKARKGVATTKKQTTKTTKETAKNPNRKARLKVEIASGLDDLELEYKDTDDESIVEMEVTPRKTTKTPTRKYDADMEFPHYWTEVLSPVTNKYLPVDAIVKNVVGTNRDLIESLEPRGAKADKARQIMAYIVGYSQDGTGKDVTVRYLKRNMLPGRTKGVRMTPEKVPVYNRHGKVKRYDQFDWFKTVMSGYLRGNKNQPITGIDKMEETTDLKPAKPEKKEVKEGQETLQYYKQSKEFVLERHLKREEALKLGAKPTKVFKNKGKGGKVEEEDVFLRSDVLNVKSAETWHKQGRAPMAGEKPLKRVPYRAATLNRRREIMEAEAATGEKVLQGLYSWDQTDWIIPPPIKDGVIPKNEYGNIDLFAAHMLPSGALHVPFRGAMRVCKKLQIDYAEAVVDFEFGHRMAVPVIQGVVIAQENHDIVMEELEKDEAERARKEDEKRRKKALAQWRRFLMGMRIAERIRQEYGEITDEISVFGHARNSTHPKKQPHVQDEDMAGGFLPDEYEEEEEEDTQPAHYTSTFFPAVDEDDDDDGGLVMEHDGADQQKAIMEMEVDGEQEPAQKSQAKAGPESELEPRPEQNTKLDAERMRGPEPEPEPGPGREVRSEAESEPPKTKAKSGRRAPAKQTGMEQPPSGRATRRSTRSGRKAISYNEDAMEGEEEEMGDSYAESEDDE
ncbi:xeroderma pigmentosum group C-complementing protein [Fusarium austroafricanum]|uniref:Xeroderma pigmentosum group C-complementing protein n=1 Tax=Fusarium austroafricanum TaxID=2364996 RepID=A0A8H4K874_9HYPO|nr:xeroderma pigmentosum group C-complementing protein [Fusarium austroafricanum]